MLDTQKPLIAEFLKDHQQFSRLIYEISQLLEQNRIDDARRAAGELNEVAGPHIEYEEAELYSRLEELGVKSVTNEMLLAEHHEMLEALRALVTEPELDEDRLESVKQGFQKALSHAEHCGSLISIMSRLDDDQQSRSLARLKQFREQGKKWLEL